MKFVTKCGQEIASNSQESVLEIQVNTSAEKCLKCQHVEDSVIVTDIFENGDPRETEVVKVCHAERV